MDDPLTRPERFAQLGEARHYLREIYDKGGCAFCLHRDKDFLAWGRSVCAKNNKRSFPACHQDGLAPAFEIDPTTLKRKP